MSQYCVVISFQFEGEQETNVFLDTIDNVQVDASSTITEHPVPTGDIVADHMFKNPVTMTISGTVSLAGSSQKIIASEKLVGFQELFEKIKNSGTLCTIYKLNKMTNEVNFVERKDMALQNISWTEEINSLTFRFTFRQVLAVTIQEYEPAIDDTYLPNVTEPVASSFTDTLLDWNQIDQLVVQMGRDLGFITSDFLLHLSGLSDSELVRIGLSVAVGAAVGIGLVKLSGLAVAAGLSAIPGVNILVAASAIGIGVYLLINKVVENNKFRIQQFEYYEDDREMQQEVERFSNFMGQIHTQVSQLNQALTVYGISSDSEQECMLTISNNYYIFNFTKNNTSNKYCLKVYDAEEKKVAELSDITSAVDSFYECTDQNYLFLAAESGYRVYLIKTTPLKPEDLTSYSILISSIKLSEFNQTLEEIIRKAIVR